MPRPPSDSESVRTPDHDHDQTLIPPSFEALYRDARGRLTATRVQLAIRYELCEDMAQMLVEPSQAVHHDQGVSEDLVLARTQTGLATPDRKSVV